MSQDCVLGELAGQALRLPVGTRLLELWWSGGSRRLRLPWILSWPVAERRPFCALIHYSSPLFAAPSFSAVALLAPASLTPSHRDTSGPAQEWHRLEEAENREYMVPFGCCQTRRHSNSEGYLVQRASHPQFSSLIDTLSQELKSLPEERVLT